MSGNEDKKAFAPQTTRERQAILQKEFPKEFNEFLKIAKAETREQMGITKLTQATKDAASKEKAAQNAILEVETAIDSALLQMFRAAFSNNYKAEESRMNELAQKIGLKNFNWLSFREAVNPRRKELSKEIIDQNIPSRIKFEGQKGKTKATREVLVRSLQPKQPKEGTLLHARGKANEDLENAQNLVAKTQKNLHDAVAKIADDQDLQKPLSPAAIDNMANIFGTLTRSAASAELIRAAFAGKKLTEIPNKERSNVLRGQFLNLAAGVVQVEAEHEILKDMLEKIQKGQFEEFYLAMTGEVDGELENDDRAREQKEALTQNESMTELLRLIDRTAVVKKVSKGESESSPSASHSSDPSDPSNSGNTDDSSDPNDDSSNSGDAKGGAQDLQDLNALTNQKNNLYEELAEYKEKLGRASISKKQETQEQIKASTERIKQVEKQITEHKEIIQDRAGALLEELANQKNKRLIELAEAHFEGAWALEQNDAAKKKLLSKMQSAELVQELKENPDKDAQEMGEKAEEAIKAAEKKDSKEAKNALVKFIELFKEKANKFGDRVRKVHNSLVSKICELFNKVFGKETAFASKFEKLTSKIAEAEKSIASGGKVSDDTKEQIVKLAEQAKNGEGRWAVAAVDYKIASLSDVLDLQTRQRFTKRSAALSTSGEQEDKKVEQAITVDPKAMPSDQHKPDKRQEQMQATADKPHAGEVSAQGAVSTKLDPKMRG